MCSASLGELVLGYNKVMLAQSIPWTDAWILFSHVLALAMYFARRGNHTYNQLSNPPHLLVLNTKNRTYDNVLSALTVMSSTTLYTLQGSAMLQSSQYDANRIINSIRTQQFCNDLHRNKDMYFCE